MYPSALKEQKEGTNLNGAKGSGFWFSLEEELVNITCRRCFILIHSLPPWIHTPPHPPSRMGQLRFRPALVWGRGGAGLGVSASALIISVCGGEGAQVIGWGSEP